MSPNKRIKKTPKLECEWDQCQETFRLMDNFCKHIEEHLTAGNIDADDFDCFWRDCGFCSVDGPEEFRRHLLFHCYHTKLKQLGQQVLDRHPELGCCSISSQSRNGIPDIPENFICQWKDCEQPSYENPEWFYRHVEMHTLSIEIPSGDCEITISCGWKDCEATAKGRPKLREHLRSHTQEKVVACPKCGGMFANNTKLLDHIIRQSTTDDERRFHCNHCFKGYATVRLLRDHMRIHVSHYKCPLCDMTCPSPSSRRNHIKFRHSNEKPYSCDYCEYSCKNQIDLRKHLVTHCSEPAFRCYIPGCGFTARSNVTMKAHHKKQHEGSFKARYKCHVCSQCFTRGNSLTIHLHKKHKFKWPAGHPRFKYKEHEDGFMRLQLIRYESVELTEQLMSETQTKQAEEGDEEKTEGQKPNEECAKAAVSESYPRLEALVVEKQKTQDLVCFTERGDHQDQMMLTLTNDTPGEDCVILQLQEIT